MSRSMSLPLRSRTSGSLHNCLETVRQSTIQQSPSSKSSFSTSIYLSAKAKGRKEPRVHRDPYHEAQAAQLKAANLARREVLKKERAAALGDPVRSKSTPFIRSLRQSQPLPISQDQPEEDPNIYKNFYTTSHELNESLKTSSYLTKPVLEGVPLEKSKVPLSAMQREEILQERLEEWELGNKTAPIALDRITSLSIGNSGDRKRVNIQRCIEEFGRHNTDQSLPPRPQGPAQLATPAPPPKYRSGRDTGSSEVQVAILSTKIDKLAEHVAQVGHKDKHNKRNLRLLVHKRQKLLAYLRRRERGGPRWQNVMEKLGLSDGAWQGEISM